MNVENINYEYKSGVLVQLENDDTENLVYNVDWIAEKIFRLSDNLIIIFAEWCLVSFVLSLVGFLHLCLSL